MITQITAFSGRKFCLDKVIRGIEENCDPEYTHFIWIDNSRDEWFHKALEGYLNKKQRATLLIENSPIIDINKAIFTDKETKTNTLIGIAHKMSNLYQACFNKIKGNSELTWIVEDDVEVPKGALSQLYKTLHENKEVGTVIGRMLDRRAHEHGKDYSVISDYTIKQTLGSENRIEVDITNVLDEASVPKFGVQLVGTGHFGCWLTRSSLVRELGLKVIEDGCLGSDNNWGWRLYKEKKMTVAVDWGVHCKHHYIDSEGNIRVAT